MAAEIDRCISKTPLGCSDDMFRWPNIDSNQPRSIRGDISNGGIVGLTHPIRVDLRLSAADFALNKRQPGPRALQ